MEPPRIGNNDCCQLQQNPLYQEYHKNIKTNGTLMQRTVHWLRAPGEFKFAQILGRIAAVALAILLSVTLFGIYRVVKGVKEWNRQAELEKLFLETQKPKKISDENILPEGPLPLVVYKGDFYFKVPEHVMDMLIGSTKYGIMIWSPREDALATFTRTELPFTRTEFKEEPAIILHTVVKLDRPLPCVGFIEREMRNVALSVMSEGFTQNVAESIAREAVAPFVEKATPEKSRIVEIDDDGNEILSDDEVDLESIWNLLTEEEDLLRYFDDPAIFSIVESGDQGEPNKNPPSVEDLAQECAAFFETVITLPTEETSDRTNTLDDWGIGSEEVVSEERKERDQLLFGEEAKQT